MKRSCLLLILVAFLLMDTIGSVSYARSQNDTISVLSYNVQHCAGSDNSLNMARTAQVIKATRAEVVALQELDSVCTRSGQISQIHELAELTGMHGTFAKAIDYQGGAYGIGILSKEEPLSVKRVPLPGKEPRVLLICEFRDYVFACTHLDLRESNRLLSLPIILQEASAARKPFLIAGDWNDEPDSPFMQQLRSRFLLLNSDYAPTFPADAPSICIDYVGCYLSATPIRPVSSTVLNEPVASDHRPLLCTFQLPE